MTDRRAEILDMLREGADYGITRGELEQLGFGMGESGLHIESLRYEGHGIARTWERARNVAHSTREAYTYRWVLTHDAWADEPAGAAAGDEHAEAAAAGPDEADVAAAPGGVSAQAPGAREAAPVDA